MYKVNINSQERIIELENNNSGTINGEKATWDMIQIKEGSFHLIKDNQSYNLEVIKSDFSEKTFTVLVNGNKYQLSVKDKFDELLKNLGMDNLNANKINEMKAPMPGLVLDIRVEEGSQIKKGDALLVLEAMKMENIIKSPTDGVIKKINVKKGMAVEKNQVLINFN